MRTMCCLLLLALASGFQLVPRRQALSIGIAVATLAAPLAPANAGSKSSVSPNKPEGVGANAGQYLSQMKKEEYAAMAGDKGSRGVASQEFEKNDNVVYNRKNLSGGTRNEQGNKITSSTKARTPEELGLKQWGG